MVIERKQTEPRPSGTESAKGEPSTKEPLVQIASGPARCPFCHGGVAPATQEWVACTECLARHHSTCWRENGACSSCSGTRSVGPPRRTEGRLLRAAVALALLLSGAGLVALGSYARAQGERQSALEGRIQKLESGAPAQGLSTEADLAKAGLAEAEALSAPAAALDQLRILEGRVRAGLALNTELGAASREYQAARFDSARRLLDASSVYEKAGRASDGLRAREMAKALSEGRLDDVRALEKGR